MNKLVILVLAFAIVAPALADDLIPAPFRGEPGSTYSHWEYNDGEGVYDWDHPESASFVTTGNPAEDPTDWYDPCEGNFSAQVWGFSIDPCLPTWYDALPGDTPEARQGGLSFNEGSWDINNFLIDNPAKDMWVQITYLTMAGGTADPCFLGVGGFPPADPCNPGEPWGAIEVPLTEWDTVTFGEPMYTWVEGEETIAFGEWPLAEWPSADPCDGPGWTWAAGGDEFWVDGELVSQTVVDETGWIHEVWAMTIDLNPDHEWFEMGYPGGTGILIDQIVIETLCYVPEPATMVLLGLGSLMMIRRKKK